MRFALFALLLAVVGFARAEKPIDPADMDTAVKPWDDFFEYANGGWLKSNPIPPEYPMWNSTLEIMERNNTILHELLKDAAGKKDAPAGSVTQLVGDFYASGMDEAGIEKAGLEPLKPELDRIAEIDSVDSLVRELAHLSEIGGGGVFSFGSEQDAKDSEDVIASLWQGGLGLPERDYYFSDDEKETRDAYVTHVANILKLGGASQEEANTQARSIMALETRLAKSSMSVVEMRDPEAVYHRLSPAELQKLTPEFAWDIYFSELGISEPSAINVAQPDFFRTVNELVTEVPLEDWRSYLRWQLLSQASPYLPKAFVDETFDFYSRRLSGAQELRPRWKRVMSTIDGCVGEALGQIYVAEMFTPKAKAEALKLVANLRDALRARIENLPWMGPATKKAALEKLKAMNVKIGYPDVWRDYSGLKIDLGPYVLNVLRSNQFEFQRDLAKIGKPLDRNEWYMTPQTVNAYFDPAMNEIVFPAGILQSPFFDPTADDAVNYGGIGATIGHELTHGFDDEGRKYDAKGNLRDWWTEEDVKRFDERAQAIIDQFDQFEVLDGLHINGRLTTGENIADLGGLKIAYDALQKAQAEKPAPDEIDGFTPDERFFLSYAQSWRTNEREELLRLQVKTDPHSPAKYRVNGPLANLPEFQAAFECPAPSPMVGEESKRVEIW